MGNILSDFCIFAFFCNSFFQIKTLMVNKDRYLLIATFVSDIAVFVLKRDVKLQPTNQLVTFYICRVFAYAYAHAMHMHSAVCAIARCLSVCPSVTSRCSVETDEWIELVFGTEATVHPVVREFSYLQN